jgi:hypothetical protein
VAVDRDCSSSADRPGRTRRGPIARRSPAHRPTTNCSLP